MQMVLLLVVSAALLIDQRVDSAPWDETYPKGRVVRPSGSDFDIYSVGNSSSKGLAMIVLYDIYGFNTSQTRVFCDRLASEYSVQVVMPDTFRGTSVSTTDNRTIWSATVGNWSRVSNDLIFVANWLHNTSSVKQIGLVGFCWGGLPVVRACSNLSTLFFTGISIHGGGSITVSEVQQLKQPVLLIAARNDPALQPNISNAIEQSNPAISKLCEYKTYPNVNHGFVAAGANYSNPVNVAAIDDVHLTVKNYLNKILNNNSVKLSMNLAFLLSFVCFSFHFYI